MKARAARIILVYVPLVLLVFLQVIAMLILYGGKISGKDDTMIALGTHVPALRFGWPLLLASATAYHVVDQRRRRRRHGGGRDRG